MRSDELDMLNTINFEDLKFSDVEDIEEIVTPGWGSYYCCY